MELNPDHWLNQAERCLSHLRESVDWSHRKESIMRSVAQLLANKKDWTEGDFGSQRIERVHSVANGASALEAAQLMNEHHVGALVVVDTFAEMVGIITERDILTRIVTTQRDPSTTQVGTIMTAEVISCDSATQLSDVRKVMRERRIRHIPVIDEGSLVGMVSIGDLNAASNADMSIEVKAMREYITQS